MTPASLEAEFFTLCQIADELDSPEADVPDLEPALLKILELVKAHPEQRDLFARCFVRLVDGSVHVTDWIVLFCMRELRYPEVQDALNDRFHALGGPRGAPRMMSFVSDVNWVYDDTPWSHADFFRYHWEREHPTEPWPLAERNTTS